MSTNEQLLSAIDDLLDAAEDFGLSEHPAFERVKAALNSDAHESCAKACEAAKAASDAVCMGRDELINMLDDLVPLLQSHVRSVRDWREQHAAPAAPVAAPLDEAAIRSDERERCAAAFEAEAEQWGEMRKAGVLGAIKRRGAAAIRDMGVKLEGGE